MDAKDFLTGAEIRTAFDVAMQADRVILFELPTDAVAYKVYRTVTKNNTTDEEPEGLRRGPAMKAVSVVMQDRDFLQGCKDANCEPTPRQAAKWRKGRGKAWHTYVTRSNATPLMGGGVLEGRAPRPADDEEV